MNKELIKYKKYYFYISKSDFNLFPLKGKVVKIYTVSYFPKEEEYFITYHPDIILKFGLLEYCDGNARRVIEAFQESNATKLDNIPIYKKFVSPILRKYQLVAVDFILKKKMTLLADPMGLGKTAEIISAMCAFSYTQDKSIYHAVVVCPAHLKNVWIEEIWKFSTINFYVRKYMGTKKGIEHLPFERESDKIFVLNLLNYDILEKRLVEIEKNADKYDFVVFDECHYLKNLRTKRTKAAYKLVKLLDINGKLVFSSGTPITKSPIDLYPILNMAEHPIARNWYKYATKFCDAKRVKKVGRTVWEFGTSKAKVFNAILRTTCMLRREKNAVLTELPEKIRQIICLEPSEVFKKFIDTERLELATNKINIEDFEKKDIRIPSLSANKLARIRQEIALRKIPFIVEMIRDIVKDNEKVVIFAYHHVVINALKEVFPGGSIITGKTNQEERTKIIDNFQYHDEPKILIANFECAGTGITLTRANYAIFLELDWIPTTIWQAEDRIHRMGQTKSAHIFYVVVEKTIEHYLAKKMITREKDIQKVLDNFSEKKRVIYSKR